MKLLLLETTSGESYPVARLPSPAPGRDKSGRGTRVQRIRRSVRKAYRELSSRLPYHERLCAQLRRAQAIEVIHSSGMGEAGALAAFQGFLIARHRKHTLWLVLDVLLALGGAALTPIPGPNVFFFYPAARCWGHHLARSGARHALNHQEVSFEYEPLLDRLRSHLHEPEKRDAVLEEIAARYNLGSLEKISSALG